jgi:hypothetical protein
LNKEVHLVGDLLMIVNVCILGCWAGQFDGQVQISEQPVASFYRDRTIPWGLSKSRRNLVSFVVAGFICHFCVCLKKSKRGKEQTRSFQQDCSENSDIPEK